MSINKVMITGNLTRDPDLRATASGMSVLSFGVAVNERHKNQQTGQWEDHPNYIDCTMFGARAQSVSRFLQKGSKVAIEGKLRWSQWERDGQKRSKIEVIVDDLEFLFPNNDGNNYAPNIHKPAQPAPVRAIPKPAQPAPVNPVPVVDASVYDTDIPF